MEGSPALSLAEDRWLSEQIGKPVFRLWGEPPETLPAGLTYTKLPARDLPLLHRLQSLGFQLVVTAVTFESPIPLPNPGPKGPQFRTAELGDETPVLRIARESFVFDRLHADPEIPNGVADRVKQAWVANYFSGKRGDWLVIADAGDEPAGFLLLLGSDGKLVIDLIAVAKAHRGSGLARGMIAFAASTLTQFRTMLVATQIANIPSMRLYERIGFRLVGAQYILHSHR